MKTVDGMTPAEIDREGFRALCDRLGPAGALRFLQHAGLGRGDYTRDRSAILGDVTLDDLLADVRRLEGEAKGRGPGGGGRSHRRGAR